MFLSVYVQINITNYRVTFTLPCASPSLAIYVASSSSPHILVVSPHGADLPLDLLVFPIHWTFGPSGTFLDWT